nr:hypothetical protein CFP56_36843 [Quercus suber]
MVFINTHLTPLFPKTHFTPLPRLTSNHHLGPVKITLEFTTIIAALAEPPFKVQCFGSSSQMPLGMKCRRNVRGDREREVGRRVK